MKADVAELCGGSASPRLAREQGANPGGMAKRNCEACQVLKLRLSNLRKEMTGSCQEQAKEAEAVRKYFDQKKPSVH